jgi:hypothetical protein
MEGCSPEQSNLPFLEGNAPALPKNWRARLLPCRKNFRSCRGKIGGQASRRAEKFFFFRSCRSTTLQLNPKTAAIGEWRVANGERKTSTRNAQPNFTLYALRFTLPTNFGANAPPTCHFYALRITLYAFSSSPVPRPSSRSVMCVIFVTVNSKMAKMAGK